MISKTIPSAPRRRILALLWVAGMALPGPAPAQSGDSERNFPGVLAPIYEFGRAGSGAGMLRLPSAVAVGKDDLLYVADAGNHRIQIFEMNGLHRGAFGRCGRGPSEFLFPSAMAATPEGDLYVADSGGGRLQRFTREGTFVAAWEGLDSPRGVAVSGDRIYVSEGETHRIRVFSRAGGELAAIGGLGSQPGRFHSPAGLAVDAKGCLYVADSGNHRIQKLDPEGKVLAQWGAWGGQAGLMSYPAGLGFGNGRLYLADRANHRVQVFDPDGRLLQQWGSAPSRTGEGGGRLHFPEALAVSPSGGLTVVAEPFENRIQVFVNRDLSKAVRVNDVPWWDGVHARLHSMRLAPPPPGSPPQKAGALAAADVHAVFLFDASSNALGPLVTAGGYGRKLGELNGIGGVVVDARDRLFVSDRGNRRITVYDVQRSTERPEIFSGRIRVIFSHAMDRLVPNPTKDYSPDRAVPGPLAVDGAGRLYVLDRGNAAIVVCDPDMKFVRRIPVPSTIQEFAVAPDGTIYATDPAAFQVRAFDPEGKPKASWGRREEQADDGFLLPWGIAVDDQGFVYVVDALMNCVKKFDRGGGFVKRWGAPGPKPESLSSARGATFTKPDRILVEDPVNHRAQMFLTDGAWLGSYVSGGLTTPIVIR